VEGRFPRQISTYLLVGKRPNLTERPDPWRAGLRSSKEGAMGTITTFDLDRFTRAAEERDASTQLSMYGPDAVVTITNKISQPGAPRVLRTREEIRAWPEDI